MWERYGFYTLQGLLIFYLEKVFGMTDAVGGNTVGSFTALAYILPVIGGYLADRFLGCRQAVVAGGLLMAAGFFCLAFLSSKEVFFYYLSMIAMGTGLLKPNVSALLGRLYSKGDKRRDAGYTLFYVGISMGIILASIFSGLIAKSFGWQSSFWVAGIGLLIGSAIFYFGIKHLELSDRNPKAQGFWSSFMAYVIALVCILIAAQVILHLVFAEILFAVITIVGAVFLVWMSYRVEPGSLKRMIGYLLMLGVSIVFWALFFQQFLSANLFISREIYHPVIFGYQITTSVFYGVEALAVIVFGPLFGKVWYKLAFRKSPPSDAFKFALGMLFITVSFFVLWLGIKTHTAGLISPIWIVMAYVCVGWGDLSLSPIGLSMVTKLAVRKLVGLMMGMWLLSIGVGAKLAGMLSAIAAVPATDHSDKTIDHIYQVAFLDYFWISVLATIVAFLLIPVFKKLIVS